MSLRKVTVGLALVFLILGFFAASLHEQKNFSYNQNQPFRPQIYSGLSTLHAMTIDSVGFAVQPAFVTQTETTNTSSFSNVTRMQIFNFVSENPGVSFRAVCAGLCIPVGLAQYHLGVLVRAGLVSFVRDGRYKRFFVSKRFSKQDMAAICLLRHKTAKRIFEVLLQKSRLSHSRLAEEVSVSSQALTWQMKTLRNAEFVLQVNEGLRTFYVLDESLKPQLQTYLSVVNGTVV